MSLTSGRPWLEAWLMLALTVAVVVSSRKGHRDDDDEEEDVENAFWANVGGIVVIGVVCLVGAGMFSLAAWIVCSCYERCGRRRVRSSELIMMRPAKGSCTSLPPAWSRSLLIQPELSVGFGEMSEGFYSLSTVQLVRQRAGTSITDGAKWATPLTTGKHLFEIIWPWGCRGYEATVGVATKDAPLKTEGSCSLVGNNSNSWGLDIVRRRVVHGGQALGSCPTDGSYVPDRFLMYVDVDEGTVGFGNEITFWGNVITDLPRGKPIYPMIGSNKWEANLQLLYRGSAGTSGFDPYVGNGQSFSLPPLSGPLPPTYGDIYQVSVAGHGQLGKPGSARSAWEPIPPPTPGLSAGPSTAPGPSAPMDPPPPYASPEPKY